MVGSHEQTEKCDEAVGRNSRDTSGRDQRRESNLTWQDCTQERSGEDEHHGHCVFGLTVAGDLANPTRKRQNAVTSDSED